MTSKNGEILKDFQYYKFCAYGFLKNLRLFEPFLILFFTAAGMTYFQIGILYGIREVVRNILEIPAGIIADSLGRRKTMITSFVFYILSFAMFYFSGSFGLFTVAMLLYSVGDAFRTGTHKAMIFDYLKLTGRSKQKVTYYGHTRSWSQLGSALSALIAGLLIFFTGDYKTIFLFSIVPYIINLINVATYPAAIDGINSGLSKKDILHNFKKVSVDFITALKNKHLLRAIANLSVFTGYYKALKDYLQPVLKSFALSLPLFVSFNQQQRASVVIGAVYFIIYILSSFSAKSSGGFSKRFNGLATPLNLTIVAGLIAGLLSGLFFVTGMIFLSVLFFILIYLTENLRKPIGVSYVSENIESGVMATVLSVESQAHTLVAAALAPVIGLLSDSYGPGMSVMTMSAVLLILSPVIFLKRGRTE